MILRNTQFGMLVNIAALVAPLIALMKSRIVSGRVLGVDDTSVRLQDPNCLARRKFVEAKPNDPVAAARALAVYRGLYDVEDRAKQCSAEERLAFRQRESVPLVNQFHGWLIEKSSDP
jgi:hypothetical protein